MEKSKTGRNKKSFEKYFLALQLRRHEERNLLLGSVKKQLPQLKALLARVSDERGYEEPVSCYYHASLAVHSVRCKTLRMVEALRELAPHLKLNPLFEQIVVEGTGKDFYRSRNKDHRRLLEAFFHARFMLEMAAHYGDLAELPRGLASGWAAFLYLYNLR